MSKFVDTAFIVVQYGCIAHCTFEYIADFVVCSGPSMEPTLYSNNVLFTEHISSRLDKISRGDIIIAKSPVNPNQQICKRVIGLPGDKVKTGFTSHVVPRGHVWLEGDNRGNSADSRTYGPVPKGLIKSRAMFRIQKKNSVGKLIVNPLDVELNNMFAGFAILLLQTFSLYDVQEHKTSNAINSDPKCIPTSTEGSRRSIAVDCTPYYATNARHP
ncbi:hypothetical protein Trydic_g437 [Trypoxylus dichotomus]